MTAARIENHRLAAGWAESYDATPCNPLGGRLLRRYFAGAAEEIPRPRISGKLCHRGSYDGVCIRQERRTVTACPHTLHLVSSPGRIDTCAVALRLPCSHAQGNVCDPLD